MADESKWILNKLSIYVGDHTHVLLSPHNRTRMIYLTDDDVDQLREAFCSGYKSRLDLSQDALLVVRNKQIKRQVKAEVYQPLIYDAVGLLRYVQTGDPQDIRDPELREAVKEMTAE